MDKTKVYVDACCQIPNANIKGRIGIGKCACGVYVIDKYGNTTEYSKYLGEMTVPQAEFNGLIFALDKVTDVTREEVEIWMDSQLVIKWMNKEFRMKKEHIKPLFDQALMLSQRYKSVEYFHHPRTTVNAKKADAIANNELVKNLT